MVDYVLIEDYVNMTLLQLFQYPTSMDSFFYVYFILGIVFIMSSILYFMEVRVKGTGNYVSSLAVSCFVGIILSFVGSLFGLLSVENVILMFILQIIPISLWWFGTK